MAEWRLEQAGFRSKVVWKASSVRRGRIIAQRPAGGTARAGTTVVITASTGAGGAAAPDDEAQSPDAGAPGVSDAAAADAFRSRASDVPLAGTGTVTRVLADDTEGGRHQRFILRLASGQTLLIAHNIDIAPRVPGLQAGDRVSFVGVYEWNAEGGVVHWTHHDPDGSHAAGRLVMDGRVYQ